MWPTPNKSHNSQGETDTLKLQDLGVNTMEQYGTSFHKNFQKTI